MDKNCITRGILNKYGKEFKNLSVEDQIEVVKVSKGASENALRQSRMQLKKIKQVDDLINAHPKGKEAGLKAYLATDRWEMSNSVSLEGKMRGIQSRYHSQLFEMMDEFRPTGIGYEFKTKSNPAKNSNRQSDFLDVLIDGDVSKIKDPVRARRYKEMAKSWLKVKDDLRQRFNKAGGDIKKLDNWNLPTNHDMFLIKTGGSSARGLGKAKLSSDEAFNNWYNVILNHVDLEKMDVKVSKSKGLFRKAFDGIISDGVMEIDLVVKGEGKLANQHQKSRFFKFKNAEAYKAYHKEFSSSEPYDLMMDYVNEMTSQISLMENLGPNPDLTIKNLAGKSSLLDANKIYANLAGKTSADNVTVANSMDLLRNATTAVKLPGAMITAIADTVLHAMTNHYNGLPGMKSLMRTISDLSTEWKGKTSLERRKFAAQLWVPLDHMINSAHSAARYADVVGHKGSKKYAAAILKASGLDAWTVIQKHAFHTEFMGNLTTKNYNDNFKATLKRYGITDEDVIKIRSSEFIEKDGATFVDPAKLPPELAERVIGMIVSETRYAVVEGDSFVRAAMNQGSKKGEVGGELIRTAAQFKTFPASIIANHWMRAWRGRGGSVSHRVQYLSSFIIGTTVMGAAVLQLKELSKGRTPRELDSKFWLDAMLQGGAGSLIADGILGDQREYGQSFQEFAMGPGFSVAGDIIWDGIFGTADDMKDVVLGKKKFRDAVGDANAKAVKGILGASPHNLWYTKIGMDAMMVDDIRRWSDSNFDKKRRKRNRQLDEEHGNETWLNR